VFSDPADHDGGRRPQPSESRCENTAEAERRALARARQQTRTRILASILRAGRPGGRTFTDYPPAGARWCLLLDRRGIANYVYVANLVDTWCSLLSASRRMGTLHRERWAVTWHEFFTELLGSAVADLPSHQG
jgi:hypothetical protein